MADTEALVSQLNECAERHDFEGAFKIVRGNQTDLSGVLQPAGILELLKKTTNDRLLLSFLDGVGFGTRPLGETLVALEKLLSFQQGSLVLSKAWGLGTVKRLDYFYKRITVDFKTKKGHQFTYAAAVDMLSSAPEDHILVLRQSDPSRVDALLRDQPAEFIKLVLKSYGDMSIARLEEVCVANGFVKSVNWKKFWDAARAELKKDPYIEIPVKRADPIRLKASVEDYGDGWLTAFSHETDPKLILSAVREYVSQGKFKTADDAVKAKIGERLVFAVTAARKVDDALFARLACAVRELGFSEPAAGEMRDYLWERKRFVSAAVNLPAREVGAMIGFLASDEEAKDRLYRAIPDLCFTAVSEIVARFGAEESCRLAVGEYLKAPKAPATLVTLIVGKYESFKDWAELPPLTTVLTHAIALGEGRQSGETLKMQNIVRRLFANVDWLRKVLGWMTPSEQVLFFERFQASIAWDHSMHHTIVVRMTKIAPVLEASLVRAEKKREYARVTSVRSFEARKREYNKLINEEMPANVKRIEFAKSYGDLSENAEYQYAKDEQRALMQKQSLMQADLEAVKPGDFSDAVTDEVMPGVTVVIESAAGEKTYTILGEWDNDLELGIISSKTRVAANLMGKKPGESFELPTGDGSVETALVKEIRALSDDIRAWMSATGDEAV
jgi:transcription elongation GreA/GreB family factor